jgi:hypothetical protein
VLIATADRVPALADADDLGCVIRETPPTRKRPLPSPAR